MSFKKYLPIVLYMLAGTSCTYPFTLDEDTFEERLVIEGDILVGGITDVRISNVHPLGGEDVIKKINCDAWVEAEDGTIYSSSESGRKCLIDTRSASPQVRHKLHVLDKIAGEEYVTPWLVVQRKAEIDSLSFQYDEMDDKLKFNISVSADENSQYFRWSFEEDWEYHAYYDSQYEFIPPMEFRDGDDPDYGSIIPRENSIYFCWGHMESFQIMIGTTNNLTHDKLIEHNFYSVPCTSLKLQSLYRLKVSMRTLSKEAYQYWNTIFTNSNDTGDLTAPMPSNIRGNLSSTTETGKYVIGYINASELSMEELYYDNNRYNLFIDKKAYPLLENVDPSLWYKYSRDNNIPISVMTGPSPVFLWAPADCSDCRRYGGNKNKPADWPTDHE